MIITAGKYKGRTIISPDEKITRPTLSKTRMGIFNSLYSIIGEFKGKTFLDVFGGSGIMGLEALSRGFKEVKVFEINRKSAEIILRNYKSLDLIPDLLIGDSTKLIRRLDKKYDVAFIDPPYESDLYDKVLPHIDATFVIVETTKCIDITGYQLLKEKKYGSSTVLFMTKLVENNVRS